LDQARHKLSRLTYQNFQKNTVVALLFFFFFFISYNAIAQEKAWHELLPDCPCRDPDAAGIKIGDGWAKDKGNLKRYHNGAATSFRSYPATKTSEGKSGQQCCYDINGNLILSGAGAGTPDKVSTCKGETRKGKMKFRMSGIIGHVRKDVRPWKKRMKTDKNGWIGYNRLWPPNQGNNCLPERTPETQ
jgi:hypothetical protein